MDGGGWPACLDSGVGAASAVADDDLGWGDVFDQADVGGGVFACGPVPGDDVGGGRCDQKASYGGVGAVDEDLVVDAVGVWLVGYVDVPVGGKSSSETPACQAKGCGVGGQCLGAGDVVDEVGEVGFVGQVGSGFGGGCAAVGCGAAPAGCSFAGGAVFLHWPVADWASGSVCAHGLSKPWLLAQAGLGWRY